MGQLWPATCLYILLHLIGHHSIMLLLLQHCHLQCFRLLAPKIEIGTWALKSGKKMINGANIQSGGAPNTPSQDVPFIGHHSLLLFTITGDASQPPTTTYNRQQISISFVRTSCVPSIGPSKPSSDKQRRSALLRCLSLADEVYELQYQVRAISVNRAIV